MLSEFDKLISAPLNICEDLNKPIDLPRVEILAKYSDGMARMGKALTKLHNKMACYLCSKTKWRILQLVVLRTDTRLLVIYTQSNKGFVVNLADAKRYEFMIDEDSDGRRVCKLKIKWDFGCVKLKFAEAQIETWHSFVLDTFDRIFNAPVTLKHTKKRNNTSKTLEADNRSVEFSTTASVQSHKSSATTTSNETAKSEQSTRCYPLLEDLTSSKLDKEVNDDFQSKYQASAPSRTSNSTHSSTRHSHRSSGASSICMEQNENDPNIIAEENVSGDGSTLSATSGTDSPTADDTGYWGLTSSATRSMAEFASLSQLSPHVRTHPVIVTPTSIHSYPPEHHVARVTSEIRFFQPDENNDESIEDIDNDDQTLVEQPVRSSVKSIVAKWPPRGPKESFA